MKKGGEIVTSGMMDDPSETSEMEKRLNSLLAGKLIEKIWLNEDKELVIQFKGGGRLLIDSNSPLDLSVT
jgi:hypothetical protein